MHLLRPVLPHLRVPASGSLWYLPLLGRCSALAVFLQTYLALGIPLMYLAESGVAMCVASVANRRRVTYAALTRLRCLRQRKASPRRLRLALPRHLRRIILPLLLLL